MWPPCSDLDPSMLNPHADRGHEAVMRDAFNDDDDGEGVSLAAQYLGTLSAGEARALLSGAPVEARVRVCASPRVAPHSLNWNR